MSDADYLSRQTDDAMKALAGVFGRLKADLADGASPVQWAKEYPWIAMGAGAVAGFVATSLLVPSKEQQALAKLAAIERALHPEPKRKEREPAAEGEPDVKSFKPGSNSFLTMIARELIGAIKPAIISLLTAGVTAKAAKPSEEEMEAAAANEDVKQAAGTK